MNLQKNLRQHSPNLHRCLLALAIAVGLTANAHALDWPNWRGPNHDGISKETAWTVEKLHKDAKPAWQISLGAGFASMTTSNGRLYAMGNMDDNDIIYCLNPDTGAEIWRHPYPCPVLAKQHEGGPCATPTVDGDRVYTFSKQGDAICLDAATGKVIWHKKLAAELGLEPPRWHFAGSPLALGKMVILNAGTAGIALDKKDGSVIWQSGQEPGGYATPAPYQTKTRQCVAMFIKDKVVGLAADSGKRIWEYPWQTNYDVNAATPIISGDKVFVSSGYSKGCALLQIVDGKVTEIWRNQNMRNQMNSSVLWGDHLYGFDDTEVKCLDIKDGQVKWSQGGLGKGSLMVADDKLIILSEQGKLVIAEASPARYKELAGVQILSGRCWTVPVFSNGRIYARNAAGDLVCMDVTAKTKAKSARIDWPQWHGRNRDGRSPEKGLLKKWPESGPELLWSVEGLGQGYATVSIADGLLYTTGMADKKGLLFAYDLAGNPKWKIEYGPEWTGGLPGVRSTPTINDGKIYLVSGKGLVSCHDAKTGDPIWSVDMMDKFKAKVNRWGIAESPLIDGDNVICTPGGDESSVVALNKHTGQIVWASKSIGQSSTYCSPLLIERGPKRIIATMLAQSLIGVDAANGDILWQEEFANFRGISPITPVYQDGGIYVTTGYDGASAMYELSQDGTRIKKKWDDDALDCHHGGVVMVDGYIYGANWKDNSGGNWDCLEWDTGKVMYETKWLGKGSITFADGMLYCYEEKNGTVGLIKATPEAFEIVSSFEVPKGAKEHWAHPVICDGRLYIRHGDALMAYNIKAL